MKIIFLDIDGVLNRIGTFEQGRTTQRIGGAVGLDPELVARFLSLVERTSAHVVLSSSWRKWPRGVLNVRRAGIKLFGKTPGSKDGFRGGEIDMWLQSHPDLVIERYAIIDDDSDFYAWQPLFQTSYETGLTEQVCSLVENHLLSTV